MELINIIINGNHDNKETLDSLPSWEKLFQEISDLENQHPVFEYEWIKVAFNLGSLIALAAAKDINALA